MMTKMLLKQISIAFCVSLVIVLGLQRLATTSYSTKVEFSLFPMVIAVLFVAICWPALRLLISFDGLMSILHIKTGKLVKTLSALGVIAVVVIIFESLVMLLPDDELRPMFMSNSDSVNIVVLTILVLYSFSVLMVHWTRFEVPANCIVLLNGKIKYPMERFFFYPSTGKTIQIVKECIPLPSFEVTATFKNDRQATLFVNTALNLDIAKARSEAKLVELDYNEDEFEKETVEIVRAYVMARARNGELIDLQDAKRSESDVRYNKFPIFWSGVAVYTLVAAAKKST